MNCHELEVQLSAYLDDELVEEACSEFEAHLASCGPCGHQVELERHNLGLLRSLARQGGPRAPEHLRAAIFSRLDREARRAKVLRLGRLGAAAASFALVAAVGQHEYRAYQLRLYEEDAALRHSRQFPMEIQQNGSQAIEAWFGGKLDHRVTVPQFPHARASGARILQVRDKPAALIRYDGNRPMSLFVFPDAEAAVGPIPAVGSSHGYNVVSWRNGDVVYQLVTDPSERDIRELLVPQATPGNAVEALPASLNR
jgi:mycothiol system anti-sigma-R factor